VDTIVARLQPAILTTLAFVPKNAISPFVRYFPFCKVNCLYGAYLGALGARSAHLDVWLNWFSMFFIAIESMIYA
jgi:hypothetical protein